MPQLQESAIPHSVAELERPVCQAHQEAEVVVEPEAPEMAVTDLRVDRPQPVLAAQALQSEGATAVTVAVTMARAEEETAKSETPLAEAVAELVEQAAHYKMEEEAPVGVLMLRIPPPRHLSPLFGSLTIFKIS